MFFFYWFLMVLKSCTNDFSWLFLFLPGMFWHVSSASGFKASQRILRDLLQTDSLRSNTQPLERSSCVASASHFLRGKTTRQRGAH